MFSNILYRAEKKYAFIGLSEQRKSFKKTITMLVFLFGIIFFSTSVQAQIRTLVISGSPGMPGPITGSTNVSAGTTLNYSISPVANATSYNWAIVPSSAGTVSGTSILGTVTWNTSYGGTATLQVSAVNSSGSSPPQTLSVTVAVPVIPGIITAASTTIDYNSSPTITATSASGGNGTFSYQWQSSIDGASDDWTSISGATGLTLPTDDITSNTYFRLFITSGSSSAASNTVLINVYPQLVSGLVINGSQSINYNTQPAALSVGNATGGSGSISYQWQISSTGAPGSYTDISNATGTNYSPPVLTSTTYYQLEAISGDVTVSSIPIVITVYPQLTVNISPASQSIYPGNPAQKLNAIVTGGNGTYTYLWQSNTTGSGPGANWVNITGATGQVYDPTPTGSPLAVNTYYQLIVTSNGVTVSNVASINVTDCTPLNTMLSSNVNFIEISTPRTAGITNAEGLVNRTACDLEQTIEYFDGLGRPLQTIQVAGSPNQNDFIQPFAYDQFGRGSVKYLPYTSDTPTPGAYQPNALTGTGGYTGGAQYQFYNTGGQDHVNTNFPYSGTNYEPSPLDRVVESAAPGASWQLSTDNVSGGGHTVTADYESNDQSVFNPATLVDNPGSRMVALYTVTINSDQSRTLTRTNNTATYNNGMLYLTITRNENWNAATDGCLNTTEEYKDMLGRIVLKRTYNQAGGALQMLSTYYVYDDFGLLAFVLPPGSNPDAATAISQATLDNICYQYRYDGRKRLTQKKLPGKGWEFTVYNTIDQVVMTQDANQRNQAPQSWINTKYDGVGRVINTGIWTYSGSVADASISTPSQTEVLWLTNFYKTTTDPKWEARASGTLSGYDGLSDPAGQTKNFLTLNFYDDYLATNWIPVAYSAPANASTMTTGLLTASFTNVLGTTQTLAKVIYYDDLGRSTSVYSQHYFNAVFNPDNHDLITTTYSFTNVPTTVTRQHFIHRTLNTTPVVTVFNKYDYDHMDRRLNTWEQITNGTRPADALTLLSNIEYNEIGQLLTKSIHSTDGVNFLQYVFNTYNERGWLVTSDASLFAMQLNYNTGANPQYNGNIAAQLYGTLLNLNNRFNYTYDNLNRLMSGTSTDNNYSESGISYDMEGNINTLSRVYGGTLIDNLSYTYNGNQLGSVNDLSADASGTGYKSGNWTYAYDVNGNMTTDNSKGITTSYNLLDLPQSIPALNTTYIYTADGQKVRRVIGTTATDYINGIEYDGAINSETITFIQTEEGRAIPNGTTAYNYEYNLTDHLGNVRLTFDSSTGVARTVQQDNYMPFGMDISASPVVSPQNLYLYNKKELQLNTQLYDYGARFYDPVIARWTAVDKESEKYESYTPYAYVLNRPTVAVDPDGKRIYFIGGANNDQDGWNYIQRWQQTFAKNGINDFHRMNESNGKYHDIMFTNNYRNSATEPVIVSAGRFAASTGETRPVQNETIDKTVADYKKDLQDHPLKEGEQFNMVGYSYGSVLQAQAAIKLANSGQVIDNLVLIGSPISDKSDLYNDLTSNKNIKNVIRYDIKGDAISNPQGVYDFLIKGGLIQGGGQGDKAHHFDAARPGAQANQLMDTIVKWLQQQGVKN
ncbi:RHS repeat-associated protein [Mucilaginibacter frigoritolerans]|uniref:RHS repeat-associated protein n=1 Tax=Mucilaginibacter frigoritolerans TaxID=652788 RepID=A0A562TR83_9SPHI|nr:DUF6443 domain-containing protein [Mucilaginibacter frigoritolerans]TWI95983.1 RHS repeat-associated protein [Mucilaginibacter frigoritolerans]